MFFVAFFWAFFHSSLAPTIEIGSIWPPIGFVFSLLILGEYL
jgi:cytochrome c oxidase subunit 3